VLGLCNQPKFPQTFFFPLLPIQATVVAMHFGA
jgi:hypothetical protein